jgi:hypothetical protein
MARPWLVRDVVAALCGRVSSCAGGEFGASVISGNTDLEQELELGVRGLLH